SPTSVPPHDDNHRNASWLLSLRTKFLERAGGSDGGSRSRAAKEKPSRAAAPLLGAAVTEIRFAHGDLVHRPATPAIDLQPFLPRGAKALRVGLDAGGYFPMSLWTGEKQ